MRALSSAGFPVGFAAMGFLLLGRPAPLGAQGSELSVEVGASTVKPPVGVEGEAARFLVSGIRAMRYDLGGTGVMASFLVGRSLDESSGGDFYSGTLDGSAWAHFSGGWSAGVDLKAFAFEVVEPFPYRSIGVEGGPSLRFSSRHLVGTVKGITGVGRSRTLLQRYTDGPSETVEEDLWRYGASAELLAGSRRLMGGVSLGIHESPGGTYHSGGLRLIASGDGPALELRVDLWETATGRETTGGIALIIPFGGWDLRGFLGRTEPDPLTLAEPGGGVGGLLLGRRILGRDPLPPAPEPLHRIVEFSGEDATVEIRLQAPRGRERLELLGDFTRWEPLAMRREGEEWVVRTRIPEGTYHFGFLADGEWYLPEGAPDAVPDEWGRRNATLVIER